MKVKSELVTNVTKFRFHLLLYLLELTRVGVPVGVSDFVFVPFCVSVIKELAYSSNRH